MEVPRGTMLPRNARERGSEYSETGDRGFASASMRARARRRSVRLEGKLGGELGRAARTRRRCRLRALRDEIAPPNQSHELLRASSAFSEAGMPAARTRRGAQQPCWRSARTCREQVKAGDAAGTAGARKTGSVAGPDRAAGAKRRLPRQAQQRIAKRSRVVKSLDATGS